jgi:ferrochelatase
MSFHGIPRDYFEQGDPYHCECHKTARLLGERLALPAERWQVTFQSRLGPKEWLRPYTDETLRELATSGIKAVDVICPGFSADCLETLEEIAMENRDTFLEAGGETYRYIPCLNDTPAHIEALTELVRQHTQGWPEAAADYDPRAEADARSARAERARQMGAEH